MTTLVYHNLLASVDCFVCASSELYIAQDAGSYSIVTLTVTLDVYCMTAATKLNVVYELVHETSREILQVVRLIS